MELFHTFCILMTITIIQTILAQSAVDTTLKERIATNSKDFLSETTHSVLNRKSELIPSDFEMVIQESETNKKINSNNMEIKISNEIDLETNSSEGVIIKRSAVRVELTEAPSIDAAGSEHISVEDSFDAKSTTSDNVIGKAYTPSPDLLFQFQDDVSGIPPTSIISDIPTERSEETGTDIEEKNGESLLRKTSVSESPEAEPAKEEIPEAESSVLKSFESNVGSDYSNAEGDQTSPVDLSATSTDILTSRSFKTVYSDFKTSNMGGPTDEVVTTESLQTQPTRAASTSSMPTTGISDRESKSTDDDFFSTNFEEERSESRNSFSTAEVEIQHSNGSTKNPAIYTIPEENQSNEDLGLKIDDNAVEIVFTLSEDDGDKTAAETSTQKGTEEYATRPTAEPSKDEKTKIMITNENKELKGSTEISITEESDGVYEDTVTELHERREDITLSSEILKSTDDTENNSTRIPKRIQEPRYTDARYRPRPPRPDPGYPHGDDRPYRPDDLLYSRGQRPSLDSYTPLRRESDFSRPARPDPYIPAGEFSRHGPDYSRQSSSDAGAAKPYRPQTSFASPYVPQGSFGRPYRPDRDHTKNVSPQDFYSKTTEEFSLSSKPDSAFFGASQSETDFSESSHVDDYDGKTSEASEFEHQRPNSDIKPMVLTPDVFKPYRPPVDTRVSPDREELPRPLRPVYLPSSSTVADSDVSKTSVSELSPKPAFNPDDNNDDDISRESSPAQGTKGGEKSSRPSGSYPRPGFGSNYGQPIGTSPKPFTPGTITLGRNNLTRVEYIKADCFDNHMKVSIRFNGSFNGLVYSSGYSQDPTCSYINGSGRYHYEFFIRLNRCGTLGKQEVAGQRIDPVTRRRQDRAQYLVNTVTVQYNPVIEEEIDEHFRVTCEYGYDFWKTVTFPVVSVESSAMKVRTGSPVVFTLPPPQCNMEIRSGYGPSGSRVSGPVNVGDPLTLVIHMKSESAGFDILVSNCFAHNGAQKRLQLIDSNGCVIQEKLISPFRGVSSPERSQQVTLYSYLKAFRFTGSPALYIECDVHMCHGSCPPQRCYWRHLYKRSVENETATSTEDPVISESVSLFQSLEVRNEESDRPNSLAVSTTEGHPDEDMVCFRAAGFAAILASLLVVLVVTCLTSICLCSRIRKMKTYFESTDTKHFIQFDINTQRK